MTTIDHRFVWQQFEDGDWRGESSHVVASIFEFPADAGQPRHWKVCVTVPGKSQTVESFPSLRQAKAWAVEQSQKEV